MTTLDISPRAGCHPSRSHHARGLCYPCYRRAWGSCAFTQVMSPRHWTITILRDPSADPVTVERLVTGIPVRATTAERVEAALTLTARGYSAAEIAERLHIAARTVVRYRGKARAA